MAKKDSGNDFSPTNTSGMEARRFDKNLQKDTNDYHVQDNEWIYARNAINNSNIGDLGRLGNEPANRLCITAPYTIIGFIYLENDKWAVFSTDNTNSEIGYYEEGRCLYAKIVNDPCLKFSTEYLIYGQSRKDAECNYVLYWADGNNVDRFLRIGNLDNAPYMDPWPGVPYACQQRRLQNSDCYVCDPIIPYTLNCDKTRLETLMRPICFHVSKDAQGGELLNGSYFVTGAYTVDGLRVTDYFTPSNVQPLFDHSGTGGSIKIDILDIDDVNFEEFELVVISVIAQQTVAKKLGIYSTRQQSITIDIIDTQLASVPVQEIPVSNVIYEKSDAMYEVNDYLLRVGPKSKFNFNYQPLANQIRTKWHSVEYSENYYQNGGNNTGYMRDEVYSFFIRWVYNTGDRSASFHIPGRPMFRATGPLNPNQPEFEIDQNGDMVYADLTSADTIEVTLGINNPFIWQSVNTAQLLPGGFTPYLLCDGGVVVAEGYMGYWESTEKYPDNKPEIWNSSYHEWSSLSPVDCPAPPWPYPNTLNPDYDLCGQSIRHHRFPDNDLDPSVSHFRPSSQSPSPLSDPNLNHIRILSVSFENIRLPMDNYGKLIPGIIGYEILRGSRKGNRSVIAKGMINNMVGYNLDITGNTTIQGLYQNYPYNDLLPDNFLSKKETSTDGLNVTDPNNLEPIDDFKENFFSFHSPETNFANPYLSSVELKVYQDISGTAAMRYQYVEDHPKEIFLKDFAAFLAMLAGIATAVTATTGKKSKTTKQGVAFGTNAGTLFTIAGPGAGFGTNLPPHPLLLSASVASGVAQGLYEIAYNAYGPGIGNLAASLTGLGLSKITNPLTAAQKTMEGATIAAAALSGFYNPNTETYEYGAADNLPFGLWIATSFINAVTGSLPPFLYYVTEGAELAWRAMYTFAKPMNRALQMISHCYYDDYTSRAVGQRRRIIGNQAYIDNALHSFSTVYRINNLYRGRYVALEIQGTLASPTVLDQTRTNTRLRDLPNTNDFSYRYPEQKFNRQSSSYYAAIKQRLRNQYGQIESITQIPISCVIDVCPPSSFGQRVTIATQEGFDQRLPQGLFASCLNNIIVDYDFSAALSIGSVGNPLYPWYSDQVGFWNNSVFAGQTVAKNSGTLSNPNDKTWLVQLLRDSNNAYVIIQNGQPFTLSFDIFEFPNTPADDYTLNIYLGVPASTSLIGTVTSSSVGSLITPVTFSVPANSVSPTSGTLDRLVFEIIGPESPFVVTAEFQSSNFNDSGSFYWNIAFNNVQNNTNGVIQTGQYFSVAQPINGLTPNFYSGSSKPSNYITNLVCPTQVLINLSVNARKFDSTNPFAADGTFRARLMRIFPGIANGNAGVQVGPDIIPTTILGASLQTLNANIGIIIPNPLPTDRYYLLIETKRLQWAVQGYTMNVYSCFSQFPVSISNICLNGNTFIGISGCMDPDADNYNPDANINCCCEYVGCTDPSAVNYNPTANVPCEDCGGGVNQINCCCVYFTDPPPGGVFNDELGVGQCSHSCLPVTSGTGNCIGISTYNSYPLFGGDIYVNRYTEKNSFFYFTDWPVGQPDRTEWDYLKYRNIGYPTYWYNSEALSITSIAQSWFNFLTNPANWSSSGFAGVEYPSKYHVLDRPDFQLGLAIKLGYVYLFNSGVRDFFVESEYNVDLRDFGDEISQRHYKTKGQDAFTDTSAMFSPRNIQAGNYYKYDTSLSIAKIWYSYVGWGNVYPRSYKPLVAETCYVYRPNRIIYSLPAGSEVLRDNWRIFLTNNYKDFLSKVMVVKQINKSGAVILFESDSPVMFQGTDQLQTDLGTKLTIGDGGLFSQPMQSLMNAERSYEYGSCQNRLSVINTPVGTFWINQNQGKIFYLSSGLTELSMTNVKWWLSQYLPYQLTKYFPDYKLIDNPVAGIGCQATYDNTNNLVYFTKKDYKPKLNTDGTPLVGYDIEDNEFYILVGNSQVPVSLDNTDYFEEASWTISYDVKIKAWISFHDWHPDLTAAGKNTFMTTKDNGVWVHNQRCDLYANYYGVDYPFEVEYMVNTIQTVNTLRSIEYQLEAYRYNTGNCHDRFHVLDFNFDEAVIYNTEQCSGKLKLNLTPKNNAPLILAYPQVNLVSNYIDILYSKEENKYRFNQFWDTTIDRGEFSWSINDPALTGAFQNPNNPTLAYPGGSGAPGNFAQRTIWNTEPNGYVKDLNLNNLNYNKSQLQRKKFRHYTTSVFLRRKVSGDRKMLVSIANNKNLVSPR